MFFCMFEGYLNAAALICIADGIVDKNGEKLFNFMLIANTGSSAIRSDRKAAL